MRKRYDEAFKRDAVGLVESGQPRSRVAHDLGIDPITLRNWINQYGGTIPLSKVAPPTLEAAQVEIRRLQRDLAYVRQQRDILKKTLGIFAHPQNNDSSGSTL